MELAAYSKTEHESTVIITIISCIYDSIAALHHTSCIWKAQQQQLELYKKLAQVIFKALLGWVEVISNLYFTNLSNNALISHSFHD